MNPMCPLMPGPFPGLQILLQRLAAVNDTPYAHYQYYGEVYGPNFLVEVGGETVWRSPKNGKKSPTGRKLQYNKEVHPQAGSFWFERAMADHKEDVLTAAKEAIR